MSYCLINIELLILNNSDIELLAYCEGSENFTNPELDEPKWYEFIGTPCEREVELMWKALRVNLRAQINAE